ncbi:MAG TPA: peptidylprolyl isomerase [Dongiaceae bacterium]|nr:peptidylprolyl isomerase [Dongiaceae bacterium]
MSNDNRIGPGKRVTLHFSVLLLDGSVVDSTKSRAPATFSVGDGNLLPGFEQSLFGLKPGDKRSIVLEAANAFGPHNPENIHVMRRGQFSRDLHLAPGVVVSFADKSKAELPGMIAAVEGDSVTVDFNHPLAGRDLTFQVEIINVVDADSQTVHMHG